MLKVILAFCLAPLLLLIQYFCGLLITRQFLEGRFIPSTSMMPTLWPKDRLLLEKGQKLFARPYHRGEIIVFYPPKIETRNEDIATDIPAILGRLTGLACFPNQLAYVKRVIGLPGDKIRIVAEEGVYINGVLLKEKSYVSGPPKRSLSTMTDIGGLSLSNQNIQPYAGAEWSGKEIIVPAGHLFVLTDSRETEHDSRTFGMLDKERIIGRVAYRVFPRFSALEKPDYQLETK